DRGLEAPGWFLSDVAPRMRDDIYAATVDYAAAARDSVDDVDLVDVIITNPPYRHALAFVERALKHAPVVAMLLRVTWLQGAPEREPERLELLRRRPPSVYVLPDRPAYVRDGIPLDGSDSCPSAWVVWGLPDEGVFRLLEATPASIRNT